MSNFNIPNRPAGSDTRHIADIEADFDYVTGLQDNAFQLRKLIWQGSCYIPAGTGGVGTHFYVFCQDGSIVEANAGVAVTKAFHWFHLSPTYDSFSFLASKVPKIFLNMSAACGTSPGTSSFGVQLNALTLSLVGGNMVPIPGSVYTSAGVGNFIGNGTLLTDDEQSAASAYPNPAADVVPLVTVTGGPTAASSSVSVNARLYLTYT